MRFFSLIKKKNLFKEKCLTLKLFLTLFKIDDNPRIRIRIQFDSKVFGSTTLQVLLLLTYFVCRYQADDGEAGDLCALLQEEGGGGEGAGGGAGAGRRQGDEDAGDG